MTTTVQHFRRLGLRSALVRALTERGYAVPAPIQAQCIPTLLQGRDVVGVAQTGSGKTAAFVLPCLQSIDVSAAHPQVLILTPTRELAIQIGGYCVNLGKYSPGLSVSVVYGGQPYAAQTRVMRRGAHVVVGTVGRLLDYSKRKILRLHRVRRLVIDEADQMLRTDSIRDVESIVACLPPKHQTALFSATMPDRVQSAVRRFVRTPRVVRVRSLQEAPASIVQTYWLVAGRMDKSDALTRFLETQRFRSAVVFVRTKRATLRIQSVLEERGHDALALNGDMNQSARERTLRRFASGTPSILVATDLAARGLDIRRIDFVVNYDMPIDVESYVHRVGRTGRAGRRGCALLFVEPRERRLLAEIQHRMARSVVSVRLPSFRAVQAQRLQAIARRIRRMSQNQELEKYRVCLKELLRLSALNLDTLTLTLLSMDRGARLLVAPRRTASERPPRRNQA